MVVVVMVVTAPLQVVGEECQVWSDCHQEGGTCYLLADAGCVCKASHSPDNKEHSRQMRQPDAMDLTDNLNFKYADTI